MAVDHRKHTRGYERLNERIQDRGAKARAGQREGADDDTAPTEALVCPSCRKTFVSGTVCLECDVHLVGESFVDSWQPEAPDRSGLWIAFFVVLVAAACLGGPFALAALL